MADLRNFARIILDALLGIGPVGLQAAEFFRDGGNVGVNFVFGIIDPFQCGGVQQVQALVRCV